MPARLTSLIAVIGMATAWTGAQSPVQPAVPNPYHEVQNWAQLPAGRVIGATSAIAIDHDGKSVWVFERCGGIGRGNDTCAGSSVAPLLKFNASGRLIASYGAGMFVYPHGIYVDHEGNIWVADGQNKKDAKGQQVVKFSPAGKVQLTLGTPGVSGDGPHTFNQPSAVVVAPNGDIFVGDGHGAGSNARIVKFSKDGTFIKAWGKRGTGPGEFNTPHSLAMDEKGRLFVADRGNNRIEIFNQDGAFLGEWKQFGNPSAIYIRNGMLFASGPKSAVGNAGVSVGNASDGNLLFFSPDPDPLDPPQAREGIAVDSEGSVYLAKTGLGGVRKLVKQSPATR